MIIIVCLVFFFSCSTFVVYVDLAMHMGLHWNSLQVKHCSFVTDISLLWYQKKRKEKRKKQKCELSIANSFINTFHVVNLCIICCTEERCLGMFWYFVLQTKNAVSQNPVFVENEDKKKKSDGTQLQKLFGYIFYVHVVNNSPFFKSSSLFWLGYRTTYILFSC